MIPLKIFRNYSFFLLPVFYFLFSVFYCVSQELPEITAAGIEISSLQVNHKLFFEKFISFEQNSKSNFNFIKTSDTISLPFIDDFSANNYNLWVDSFAYINNSFAANPPTVSVATLDGVDKFGLPYDFSSSSSFGYADNLTSVPIDLGNFTVDSLVVLSFYYEPQGLGDYPETTDSLTLEFYSPQDSLWYKVWSERGQTYAESQQTPVFTYKKISITDSKFLLNGFQFRFRNKATLSGMYDIWNIDYVYLDKNRNINDNSLDDFAFEALDSSFVNTYTSMPMKAFKGNAGIYMKQNFKVKLANLSNDSLMNDSCQYFVYLDSGNQEELKFSSVNLQQSFVPLSQQTITHSVFSSPNIFQFIPIDSPRVSFKIKFIAEQTGIANEIFHFNDTVIHRQIFDSYYSYDDGSPEKALAIIPQINQETYLAYKFTDIFSDSLKGLYVLFPKMFSDFTQYGFKITVWSDNNGVPGSIIYQNLFSQYPQFPDSLNEFVRYKIDNPLHLGGTFYIGWVQNIASSQDEKIRIGFDKNINNQNRIFFNTNSGNGWESLLVSGSLLIRPDFGEEEPHLFAGAENKPEMDFNIYPNPNDGNFNLKICEFENLKIKRIEIYNMLGEIIFSKQLTTNLLTGEAGNEQLTTNLPNGIYFVKCTDGKKNNSPLKKLIIAK